jgi:Mrp family chromosome partitioning ATPase
MGNRTNEHYALLTDYGTDTAYSEAFHTLFANIRFSWNSDKAEQSHIHVVHSLLLTTPSNHHDQAAVAANLAIVAAQSSTPTLLVDADLRAPKLEQRFGLGKNPGLSDLLQEEGPITSERVTSCLRPTFVPGLKLIGAGTASTQGVSLLLSPKLQDAITCFGDILAREAEESRPGIVIFHSAPVLAGADASLIGALTEQAVLTIVVGHTTRAQAKQAQEQLERAHTKLSGIVMLKL